MRLLIDFKLDSYGKLVEFLLPEDNCLIKSKLTFLFDREMCHLFFPFTKNMSNKVHSWSKLLGSKLFCLFSGPVLGISLFI